MSNNTYEQGSEIALLICSANAQFDAESKQQMVKMLSHGPVDWERLAIQAQYHRLMPSLYQSLCSMPTELVPKSVLQQLHKLHFQATMRSLLMVKELMAFLDILEAHEIESLVFKGPAIAISVYKDLSLRPFADMDILVHSEDFVRLRKVAEEHGYQCDMLMAPEERECLSKLSAYEQETYFRSQKEFSLLKPQGRIFIDVHQGILSKEYSLLFNSKWVWQYIQNIDISGKKVRSLTPEANLIVLCVQGATDFWMQLGKLYDVAVIVRDQPIEWNCLIEQAKRVDALPSLLLGLKLMQQVFHVALPDDIMQLCEKSSSVRAAAKSIQKDIVNRSLERQKKTGLAYAVCQMQLMQNWRNRIFYCFTLMTPTLADLAAIRLPRSLFFAYYLLRPIRLFQKGTQKRAS